MIAILIGVSLAQKKPFQVINYDGYRKGQGPHIKEPSKQQVREDLEILAPYTHGIRTYGVGGHYDYIPALADELGLELHMGIWIDEKTYSDRFHYKELKKAIAIGNEGHPSITSVIVGNEFLMRSDIHEEVPREISEAKLVTYIKYVKDRIPPSIIVTTAETMKWWDLHSDTLWNIVDAIYWQAHPFWEGLPADSANISIIAHQKTAVARLLKLGTPQKKVICTETGWPTGASRGRAQGNAQNQFIFIKNLAAWANENNFEFWIFSGFDAEWKSGTEGEVGKHWGLWNGHRVPKLIIQNIELAIPKELWQ